MLLACTKLVTYFIFIQIIFQSLWMCASKFILTSIPKGERLNAFSEMEAAAKVAYEDNIYRFYFKLFVR